MDIIVCVKIVPAIDFDFAYDSRKGISDDDVVNIINPYDLGSLEKAAKIKNNTENSKITIISIGGPEIEEALRKCLPFGVDEAIRIWDRGFEGSDSWAKAKILAAQIRRIKHDIVLCGKKSIDQNSCLVGGYLAKMLNIPHVFAVTDVVLEKGCQAAVVSRKREGGIRDILWCPLPAVFSNAIDIEEMDYASFPGILSSLRTHISGVSGKEIGIGRREVGRRGSLISTDKFLQGMERPRKVLEVDISNTAEERLRRIASGGTSEKDNVQVLEGAAEDIAKKVVEILLRVGCIDTALQ